MNVWERRHKYRFDMVKEMVNYALNVSSDTESNEYKDALLYWASEISEKYKADWIKKNGDLNEKTEGIT